METIKNLFNHFDNKNISYYNSKKPGVICINGKHANLLNSVAEIQNEGFQVWESFYNNKWTTFLKNLLQSNQYTEYDDYDNHYEEDCDRLTDVFDRDELCDPDLVELWDDEARNRGWY